jgi:alkylhydroperoxidase family enzyme
VDIAVVNGEGASDGGVEHGARLIAFTEAVMRGDDEALARERAALRAVLSPECFVEVAAVVGAFNVVDRIADATGIPLDPVMATMSADVRQRLDLARFASSANTPGA